MRKQFIAGGLLALALTLAGCGGGDSSAPAVPSTGGPTTTPPATTSPGGAKVAGPLDAVQEPVSDQVLAPLSDAFTGTPLQGVTRCVDQIVVNDAVDVLDVLALAIQSGAGSADPDAALATAAAGVQVQVENMVIDLQGMLSALDGNTSGCMGNTAPTAISSNPLAGTPLEAVGTTLAPVLDQVYAALHGSSGPRPALSLTTIASLVAQLEFAVNTAMSQVPADVAGAPVIGAALSTIQAAVGNVSDVVTAAGASDTAATQAAIATTVDSMLTGVLLGVVPVTAIETQAGQAGLLSGPIDVGINSVAGEVGSNLGVVLQPVLEQNIDTVLGPVVDAIESTILGAILAPLFEQLADAGVSTSNPLGPVITVVDTFFEGASTSGSPLDLIIAVIAGDTGCPLVGTPLESLCLP